MRVLLHTCCGPCASACVPVLRALGHEVTLFYSDSNIDTKTEFDKRLAAARTLAAAEDVPLIADAYDHADWLVKAARGFEDAPEKGARCARCFLYNLRQTAAYACAHDFDAFTTSLSVSPHKVSSVLFAAGTAAAPAQGPCFLPVDFKKKDGFLVSLRRAQALGLYRQSYCGCEFSRRAVAYEEGTR